MSKMVICPTCKRSIEWSADNKWRPFCCERCKLIDLGAWASEKHAIPSDSAINTESDTDDHSDSIKS